MSCMGTGTGRFSVRRDSSSADLIVVLLVLPLGIILGLSFGTADVKGAYMQSGPIKRDVFVGPPKSYQSCDAQCKGKILRITWRLLKLPYGIVEAGSQWICSI